MIRQRNKKGVREGKRREEEKEVKRRKENISKRFRGKKEGKKAFCD